MDSDLAFCLGNFIDDQVKVIDDSIDDIVKEEIIECEKIEKQRIGFDKKRPPQKNKGSHGDDKYFVDQFIQELRNNSATNNTKTIIDDPSCIDTLRAEVATKVNASARYIVRLRNSAQPLPNTTRFVQACDEALEYFQRTQQLEENFKLLFTILEQTDASNLLENIQKWWKDAYGSKLSDLNTRNNNINKALSDKNVTFVSQTSRIIDNARKLMSARKVIAVVPPRDEIVRKFARQLLTIDEELRDKTNPNELFDQLNSLDTDLIVDYANRWLIKRDEIRNQKEEENPYDMKMEAAKAEFGRRRIAQEAKKLALAALLCRLAVGSSNGDQFDQQLKKTIKNQKNKNQENLPVISGEIKEPEAQELPVIIKLETDGMDMDPWVANKDGIREEFCLALCQAFHIPNGCIRIDNVDGNKGIIYLYVQPPYGQNVVDSLNGTDPAALVRMQAVRKCCLDAHANVESITLGEFGLKIEDKLMDPRWNKVYIWPNGNSNDGTYWPTPIDQGGKPYYCPSGWKRFGIKVAEDEKEFDARWGSWYVAYHGTQGGYATNILTSGLKVSTQGCFYDVGIPRVYVSPSIEYSGHPRYAFPWKQTKKNGQVRWYQLIFQCRVNPASVDRIGPETLVIDNYKQSVKVDPNFDNGELEWIILGNAGEQFIKKDIICYGLMMRISDVDPRNLPIAAWWKYSNHTNLY